MSESHIDKLASYLAKFPGMGPRSARRAVLYLLTQGRDIMIPLSEEMRALSESIQTCENCGNLDVQSPCGVCADEKREPNSICVVENVADLWALERNKLFPGEYHVLGGTLSAIDGRGPEQLGIEKLLGRIKTHNTQEVIIATNATIEGQTTAHYIAESIAKISPDTKVSQLAHGIPVGGELDYMDEGTLNAALSERKVL